MRPDTLMLPIWAATRAERIARYALVEWVLIKIVDFMIEGF